MMELPFDSRLMAPYNHSSPDGSEGSQMEACWSSPIGNDGDSCYQEWNNTLIRADFQTMLINSYPTKPDPDNQAKEAIALYSMRTAIVERLSRAYGIPDGPSLTGPEVSFDDAMAWLSRNPKVERKVYDCIQQDRFDMALQGFYKSFYNPVPGIAPNRGNLTDLHNHWNGKYHGLSVSALKERLAGFEAQAAQDCNRYYSKSFPLIQSSGVGKSRLAWELSKEMMAITFILRPTDYTRYPPGDFEVFGFLLGATSSIEIHSAMIAILGAALELGEFYPSSS
jgi:hypothetical protein